MSKLITTTARFSIGQVVQHELFGYRGVIVDIDPVCMASDEWYESMARSRPPKDQPWYHLLVDGATHRTYVAERNIEAESEAEAVSHPEVEGYFVGMVDGVYQLRERSQ